MVARSVERLRRFLAAAMAPAPISLAKRLSRMGGDPPTGQDSGRVPEALLDQLLAGVDPETVFQPNGLLDELRKALVERVLIAEMDR